MRCVMNPREYHITTSMRSETVRFMDYDDKREEALKHICLFANSSTSNLLFRLLSLLLHSLNIYKPIFFL